MRTIGMEKHSSRAPGFLLLAGLLVAGLILLNSMTSVQVSIGTEPVRLLHKGPSSVRPDLRLYEHWTEHEGQKMNAMETYKMLLAGECAMVARYCDEYDPNRELYLCLRPMSQLIGGIYVVGDLIEGGHACGAEEWWSKGVRQDESWPSSRRKGIFSICPDGILR